MFLLPVGNVTFHLATKNSKYTIFNYVFVMTFRTRRVNNILSQNIILVTYIPTRDKTTTLVSQFKDRKHEDHRGVIVVHICNDDGYRCKDKI